MKYHHVLLKSIIQNKGNSVVHNHVCFQDEKSLISQILVNLFDDLVCYFRGSVGFVSCVGLGWYMGTVWVLHFPDSLGQILQFGS